MHDIDLIDDSFLLKKTDTYHLSIQTGLNGLSFAVLDENKFRYTVLRHYPFEGLENPNEIYNYLTVVYHEDNILNHNFKSINHVFVGNRSTIIPQKEFNANNADNYLQFLYSNNKQQITNYNLLPTIQCYNVFSYPSLLYTNLNTLFNGVKLYHHVTTFITHLIEDSSQKSQPVCTVFLSDGLMNIGIAKNGQLLFFNTFEYKDKSDVAYFILGILEQYNMSARLTDIEISSDTKYHDEIFDFLNNFLGQIHFIKPSNKYTYSHLFDELHLTQFVNLFNLALCE
jgi:hypothetical protein